MRIRRKPIDIPPEIARQFVADMQAYHAEQDDIRPGKIAPGARRMLLDHMPTGTKLRLSEVAVDSCSAGPARAPKCQALQP